MDNISQGWTRHVDGPATYAACIALASAPFYGAPLSFPALAAYAMLALLALLTQELLLAKAWDRRMRDPGAITAKTLMGILVCTIGYAWVTPQPRPQFLLLSLMWLNLGLTRLAPQRVLVLVGAYLAIFLIQRKASLLDPGAASHGDDLFVLCASLLYTGFLYTRAYRYELLRSRDRRSLEVLHRAEEKIRDITETDPETGALRLSYFRTRLQQEKLQASGTETYCVAMVEVDQYDEFPRDAGAAVTADVLRQLVARMSKVVRKEDIHGTTGGCAPIGRVAGGRFVLLLAGWDFDTTAARLEHLHQAADLQSIRIGQEVCHMTLSIGFTERDTKDTVDETVARATRALELARAHNGNDIRGLRRAHDRVAPPEGAWDPRITARH